MKKDPSIFLFHILECIEKIEIFMKDTTSFEKFLEDSKTQDAVIRNIEIIGEATKNLPADFKKKFQNIEWKKIASMRDVLIHEYFGVDLRVTYRIAKEDTVKLKQQISKILGELKVKKLI